MKITWASNAPWTPTGYGTQTAQMLKRLVADGHDVAVAANYGLAGLPIGDPLTGVTVFPSGADPYGIDVLRSNHELHAAGDPAWLITLYDTWVYDASALAGLNVASWAPIDHAPVPPKVAEWCRGHRTIAMSKFGLDQLAKSEIVADYAPHGIELDVWKPTKTTPGGTNPRQAWGIPDDAFLVMINAANKGNVPPRKSWGEMLSAMALVMSRHDDVYLYIHSELRGVFGGVDLTVLLAALKIPAERVRWPDQHALLTGRISQQALAAFYSSADVLLATSMGEGFGIPVIEAQACGTPVIVTNFSAQPELVGAGWTVPYQPWWDFTQGALLALPMVPAIRDCLLTAREAKHDAELHDNAIAKAAEYDADKVYADHWRPILASLEADLRPPTRQQRRAKRRQAA